MAKSTGNANNSARNQQKSRVVGRPFKPGESGNPRGKPLGAINKSTRAVLDILNGQKEKLTEKAVSMAMGGDSTAMRICMERICPAPKDSAVYIKMSKVNSLEDAKIVMGEITTAVSQGEITPSEAMAVAGVVEVYRKTVENTEIVTRLNEIERQMKEAGI